MICEVIASSDGKVDAKPSRPSCPICQEAFALATTTPCCHRSFCYPCIRSWLQRRSAAGSCPRCRAPVTLQELCPNPDLDDMVAAFGLLEPERARDLEAYRKMRAEDRKKSTEQRSNTNRTSDIVVPARPRSAVPSRPRTERTTSESCFFCGDAGHRIGACPRLRPACEPNGPADMDGRIGAPGCTRCGARGHLASLCPLRPNVCGYCNDPTHRIGDCPRLTLGPRLGT